MKTARLMFFLIPILVTAQNKDTLKCLAITGYVAQNIKTLNEDSLFVFFGQFSLEEDENNVEFREWGNEILFEVLESNPELFFRTLFRMSDAQIKSVGNEINSPVHDRTNMILVYEKVKNCKLDKKSKDRALVFIKTAYENYKKMIESWEKKNNKKWQF